MRPLILPALIVLVVAGLVLALPTPPAVDKPRFEPSHFAVTGVRVFHGRDFLPDRDVIVRDGRIEAIGSNLSIPTGLARVDGRGKSLLPGLIDAHVHTFGQAQADALRFGVTTLLDMFTAPTMLSQARDQRDRFDQAGMADLYSAGLLATARGGHGTQFGIVVPTIAAPDQAEGWVAARVAEGSDFIKIVIEPGRLWGSPLPTLDEDTVRALVAAAHGHGLLALAHVSTEADAIMAVEAGVDGLVHVFADRPASPAFLALARERGIFVVPTTVVMAGVGGQLDIEALLAEDGVAERLSVDQRASLGGQSWSRRDGAALLALSIDNVRVLHAAGIPLLAGSDAPNPGTAQGLSLHRELQFLVEAGLSPAERFGLDGRGCIAPGCRADMILVDGDPEADIRATRRIAAVWKNGLPVKLEADPPPAAGSGAPARAATDLLSAGEIERWMAADDRFMSGRSQARLTASADGSIRVEGELAAGFAFPYAGAMWSAGEPFMSPVDLSDRSRLAVKVRGEAGPWMLMLFSGANPGSSQPVQIPLNLSEDGGWLALDLGEVSGLDLGQFLAFGIFAGGGLREFSFDLVEARLE